MFRRHAVSQAAFTLLACLMYAGIATGDAIHRVDFETGDLSQAQSVHKDNGAAVEVVRNPRGEGCVMKSSITPKEERAEIRVHRDPVPSERWYGWSLLLPEDYVEVEGKSDILFQWHRGGGAPRWAMGHPMVFMINDEGRYQVTFTYQTDINDPTTRTNGGGVTKFDYREDLGRWTHWALHAKWSVRDDGYLALYRDGEKVWERHGANWLHWGPGPMVKAGIYTGDPGWRGTNPTIVYHDNIIVGNEQSGISEVSPAPHDRRPNSLGSRR